ARLDPATHAVTTLPLTPPIEFDNAVSFGSFAVATDGAIIFTFSQFTADCYATVARINPLTGAWGSIGRTSLCGAPLLATLPDGRVAVASSDPYSYARDMEEEIVVYAPSTGAASLV